MGIPSARAIWAVALAALCLSGCAKSTAPRGWLPRPVVAQKTAHGGWISISMTGDPRNANHEGELIAIQSDSVFILERGAWLGLPVAQVSKATLTGYDPNTAPLELWTLGGTLSTASHGVGLVLSAPIWILVGSLTTSAQSRNPRMIVTPATWQKARAYARFPQGLPASLDRSSLRPKHAGTLRR